MLHLIAAAAPAALVLAHNEDVPVRTERDVVVIQLQEVPETWIAQGHRYLSLGQYAEAEAAFGRAADLGGDPWESKVWIARTRIESASFEDALEEIDTLADENEGPALDYLYGMAFSRKAERELAAGSTAGSISFYLGDASLRLGRAASVQPFRFRDAHLPLARAAWHSLELERARTAIDMALGLEPQNAEALMLSGKIAMSQFVAAQGTDGADPEAHWVRAVVAFGTGLESCTPAEAPAFEDQLARALVWKEERVEEAAAAWTRAVAADPAQDYGLMWRYLDDARFEQLLTEALASFRASAGTDDVRDATGLWYLGKVRLALGDAAAAEASFTEAVERWPAYANSWYYVGRARYDAGDHAGAIEAIVRYSELDPAGVAPLVAAEGDAAVVEYLIGTQAESNPGRAAVLARILCDAHPDQARLWNNLGLFLRDSGEYEAAYEAYSRALELSPEDPNLLNDTALMLHYHLDRDLDRALEMYARAAEIAERELAREDLDAETRDLLRTAHRDAIDNRGLLEAEMTREEPEQAESDGSDESSESDEAAEAEGTGEAEATEAGDTPKR